MKAREIRQKFLEFFKEKKHEFVASSPMVVKDDPTLMFINAGMNQFKDLFLGNSEVKHSRVCNSQKCLRVSGKHNDLEEVGVDTYHHTMFEMLGNWSFGDYFKKEAIEWAWEFLTETCKINEDSLYVTVFEGAKEEGLDFDQEAYNYWKKIVPQDRILMGNKKDNFWEMGATGPCGPCSEIHVDIRSEEEKEKISGKELVNQDHPQVIEVWNLVFMEFNRLASGDLKKLPAKHVDTGMGFERLAMVLQGKKSNYDSDVFTPLIDKIVEISCVKYTSAEKLETDIAIRVIADHIRAVFFAIADGQMPSNNGAGYVIRRILRRAVRYGYSKLNLSEPFMFKLVSVLSNQMGEFFPELEKQKNLAEKVIKEEEQNFLRTLDKGIDKFNQYVKSSSNEVKGDFAFELLDTYGFPIDLTELLAKEKGLLVDHTGFQKALEAQKQRSRKATSIEVEDWVVVNEGEGEFIGYDNYEAESKILRYRGVKQKGQNLFQVELDQTPFYPEGGGQVGDSGVLIEGDKKFKIQDTKKENGVILHFMKQLPLNPSGIFKSVINKNKRLATNANHTATHLVHHALREVLGDHVEQKGSLVNENNLRFDFSHFQKVTSEELESIERLVNNLIRENSKLEEDRSCSMDNAKAKGAMALFGEKYGEKVRVVKFGDSVELCGGTHVSSTSQIGKFIFITETAVAAGIRRIEAITSAKADEYISNELSILNDVRTLFKNPKNLTKHLEGVLLQNSELQKQIEKLLKDKAIHLKAELLTIVKNINGINFIASKINLDSSDAIKDLAFQMRSEVDDLFMVLGASVKGKPNLTVVVSESLVKEKGLNAGVVIRDLAKEIQGGGGGQPFYATAGGKDLLGLEKALKKAETFL
ncbi:MAG: alanine--tRNA ligase [Flavobacteriales bacterium]|nr:alanine--tRNA ligase [Flavobacteriales bacterium]|tara:strand:- start:1946 stop:4552 length:2607 start_codon:yes stop_codon:yes gene_type:complete